MIFQGLDPVLLASFSFPVWLTVSGYEPSIDLKDRFNEQRHPVDKTKIKSKPTAFSEHPEHFLSHSDHSHTDMQLIPRGKIHSSLDSVRKARESHLI